MIPLIVGFISWWSIKSSVLILFAGIACWLLKRKPGGVHAAVWTTTLGLIWIIPFTPYLAPFHFVIFKPEPVVVGIKTRNLPPRPERISGRESLQKKVISNEQKKKEEPDKLIREAGAEASVAGITKVKPVKKTGFWILHLLVLAWILGIGISLVRWLHSMRLVRGILSQATPLKEKRLLALIERTRQIFFIHEAIEIRTSPADAAPFVLGLRKPLIFLPEFMTRHWQERDQLAVIAHELAHVVRYDLAAHHSMRVLRVLLWFLPPIWWMQRELHRAQDTACDECAAVVLGSGVEFGKALTQLADHCLITNPVYPALGILHAKPSLIQRLENIMNTQLAKLSRLSFSFKSCLVAVSLCIILFSSQVQPIGIAQTLDIEFLGNYAGGKDVTCVDDLVYIDPYYALIGRQSGSVVVYFFEYKDKVLKLVHTAHPDTGNDAGNYTYVQSAVSGQYLVFLYKINGKYCFNVYDRNQNWFFKQNTIFLSSVRDIKIYDNDLYILGRWEAGDKQPWVVFRQNIKNLQMKEYTIPDYIQPTMDIDIIDGDVLLNDSNINPEELNDKPGYIRGVLTEDRKVQVSEQRWFVQPNCGYTSFFMNGPYIFLHYRHPDAPAISELNIFDWSAKDNPKFIQKFPIPYDLTENKVYQDLLIIGNKLYRLKDKQYGIVCDFPDGSDLKAIGPSMVLGLGKNELVGYDFSSPGSIQRISSPLKMAENFGKIYANGYYIYYPTQKEDRTAVSVVDAAIPGNLKQVKELSLESKTAGNFQFHDSLFTVTDMNIPAVSTYSLLGDGIIGEKKATPPLIQDPSIVRLGQTLYNANIYLQSYYFTVPNELMVSDPAYQRFYMYRKAGDVIEQEPVSILELNINDRTALLSDKYLLVYNSDKKGEIVNGVNMAVDYNTITLYSIENIERPLLLTKYRIPNVYEEIFSQIIAMSIDGFSFGPDLISYIVSGTTGVSLGIIDIRDPEKLEQQLYPVSLAKDDSIRGIQWYKNIVIVKIWEEIIFYQYEKAESINRNKPGCIPVRL